MMKRARRAVFLLAAAMTAALAGVPVFADHIAPDPQEKITNVLGEYFPFILIAVLVLCGATCAVIVIVIRKRKKKNKESDNPKEGRS